ncbi:FAD-dependent monooxygenase [Sphaerisporangium sp. NPDC005288]|uniref:FAD-dependent monooxygenase n=1 Tax=Sphaerisporangium sp. NPDC005288 TaxID=3155114 RepID=UPI0033B99C27
MNVLISGASVAGPALAYWLRHHGFEVTVVERAATPRPGGYKVDLRGVAVEVARRMGILDEVRRRSTDIRGGTWLNGAGKTLATLGPDMIGFRDPGDLEIMRGDLAEILHARTRGEAEYVFGDTITSITDEGCGTRVTFRDAAPRTFDLVVGADGLHSGTRALVFGPEERFTEGLGLGVAVFGVPNHLGLDRWEMVLSAAGHVVNVYSVRAATAAKAQFFFPAPQRPVDRHDVAAQQQAVAEAFTGHRWEVPRLLAAMPEAGDFYFDTLAQVRMDSWSRGRTVLLGDAAYCPSPASGQGTGMALVGAYVLAGELAAAQGDHRVAFARYEEEMRGFVELNQRLGRTAAKGMVPASRTRARLQGLMLRMAPHMPGKARVMEAIMKPIRKAANGIELRDYPTAAQPTARP